MNSAAGNVRTVQAPAADLGMPGDHLLKVVVQERERRALVHVPPQAAAGRELPLVIVLHGAGATGRLYLTKNGWAAQSDAAGFIVVAPEGTPPDRAKPAHYQTNPQLWNDGSGRPMLARLGTDEPAFILELLAALRRHAVVDERRVYVTGHSNGASLAFHLAERLGGHWAALAPVACHCWLPEPRLVQPVPTLYLLGTQDPLLPWAGGDVASPWFPHQKDRKPPVAASVAKWVRATGCRPEPAAEFRDPPLRTFEYRGTRPEAYVRAVFIEGHGHAWPGGEAAGLPEAIMGPRVSGVNATRMIWDFFQSHQRREPGDAVARGQA